MNETPRFQLFEVAFHHDLKAVEDVVGDAMAILDEDFSSFGRSVVLLVYPSCDSRVIAVYYIAEAVMLDE